MPSEAQGLEERTVSGLHEALARRLNTVRRNLPILDMGCGSGAWLMRLKTLGFTDLLGIDVEIARFAAPGIACTAADLDANDLALPNKTFGLITAIEVVEHLQNPGRLFFHATRLLENDGALILTTPNVESLVSRLRFLLTGKLKQFDDIGDPTHIFPVVKTCLDRIAQKHGLRIAAAWSYPDTGRSLTSRFALNLAASMLRPVLPERAGGDIACFHIQRCVSSISTSNR